jgi:hypothetical protein
MNWSAVLERTMQVVFFTFSIFMICGGGYFTVENLPDRVTRTVTYTLYRTMAPPPVGPSFCKVLSFGRNGIVMPCNYQPPFIWWLEKRHREKDYSIKL